MHVTRDTMHVTRKAGPLLGLATLAAFGLSALPAAAQTTVFTSFGPGNSFASASGYTESGPTSSFGTGSVGAAFSPSATGALSAVTVAYFHLSGTDDAHLYLTDTFSNLGNTAASLASFTFIPGNGGGSLFVLPSALHPVLTAGQTYYLYGQETGTEADGWNQSSPPVNGTLVGSFSGPYTSFANQPLPAFSVQEANPATSSVVPESSGLANMGGALLALGLAGGVMAIKKRKNLTPAQAPTLP